MFFWHLQTLKYLWLSESQSFQVHRYCDALKHTQPPLHVCAVNGLWISDNFLQALQSYWNSQLLFILLKTMTLPAAVWVGFMKFKLSSN